MKKSYPIIIILSYLSLSFNTTNALVNISKNSTLQDSIDSIVGKYYVENFTLKSNLILLKNRPTLIDNVFETNEVFEFDFQKNGIIKITDLTKSRLCANGVIYVDSARWEKVENNIYKIDFKGGYQFDSTFEIDTIYILEDTSDSIMLKINKIIKTSKKRNEIINVDEKKLKPNKTNKTNEKK